MKKLFSKILCPVDPLDDLSGLDVACALAQEAGDATLLLLYVIPVVISSAPGVNPLPISQAEAESMLRKIAQEQLEGKVRYQIYTKVGGDPGSVIVKAVEELAADSVVMATHGRKGIGHLILGSVAERVVRESPRPVLTVRASSH